jgi:cyclophilin family peptidyl-prolyl cis-trans isomerase
METSEKEDEIDTRFSIFSKYPFIAENKRYCVLGKITDGMEVLESITAADILFKIIK